MVTIFLKAHSFLCNFVIYQFSEIKDVIFKLSQKYWCLLGHPVNSAKQYIRYDISHLPYLAEFFHFSPT